MRDDGKSQRSTERSTNERDMHKIRSAATQSLQLQTMSVKRDVGQDSKKKSEKNLFYCFDTQVFLRATENVKL